MSKPSIYAYLDYRVYLEAWMQAKKQEDPKYSYAQFARDGGCSKGSLANVISGVRTPRSATLDAFAAAMSLNPSERGYLGLLVDLAAASSQTERHAVMEQIFAVERYGHVRVAETQPEADISRCLESWWILPIREMVALPGFQDDAAWIASHMVPPISTEQAQAALDTLVELDFLRRTDDGLVQRELRFRTAPESSLPALAHYHRTAIPALMGSIDLANAREQHLVAVTFTLEASTVSEVKAKLDAVINQVATLADDAPRSPSDRVYQLAVQLLPVTTSVAVSDDESTSIS